MDLSPLWLSLRVASLATLLSTVLGTLLGFLLAEGRWRGRSLVESLVTLPLILPPTVLGFYLLVTLGRQSPVGAWIERVTGVPLVFTWQAAVVAATVPALPYVVRTARAAFEAVDPSIREAASIDGARALPRLLLILLPLARRGITAGVTLAFARALGEFGATLMVAGNIPGSTRTMPIAIYDAVQAGSYDLAGVLVAILTAVAVVVLLLAGRLGAQV
ncbi:MAG: molybdate ABC transporter permease subunit [Armatimonadetes bacterium]|nr:molybdate ABC transporter permease subunit [Armatimonadota bacterium]MBI2247261.1 molybdate ABC transporter permease subunit [Armatimonadota bacterium]MBI2972491.1 molybdate ABC transporter permease subunit [Armatimonadota bacterium]